MLVAGVVAVTLAACDTGDGKTLSEPTGTLPPTTVAVPETTVDPLLDAPIEASDDDLSSLPTEAPANGFELYAPWLDGGTIEPLYTCDGADVSPPLSWAGAPPGAVEMAIAAVDESIVDGPPFVHWVVAGISPLDTSIVEGDLPLGALEALNSFGAVGYGGPCPPPGDDAHSYRFTVYALNQQVELAEGTPAADLLDFVQTVSIASADVVGTYGR